jgi:hypothetical protein
MIDERIEIAEMCGALDDRATLGPLYLRTGVSR